MKEYSKSLIEKSIATLKRMLKTATHEETKMIWAELNARGIYRKK